MYTTKFDNKDIDGILSIEIILSYLEDIGYTAIVTIGSSQYVLDIESEEIHKNVFLYVLPVGPSDKICDISPLINSNVSITKITLDENCKELITEDYNNGDIYHININSCLDNKFAANVIFIPNKQFIINYNLSNINMIIQSTLEGTDINECIFTVDKNRYICQSMIIVYYVRGYGKTLKEKVEYLYHKDKITISYKKFYENIIIYAMTKYILGKLLSNKFDFNHLLNKHHKNILSNFKQHDNILENGYNRYFKN